MKIFRLIFLIVCFLSSTIKICAQEKVQEPNIDQQLQQCLDSSKNATTAGMIDCTVRARDAWDKELNKYYKLLMQELSNDEKGQLRTAQKNWLSFRNSENLFSSTFYTTMGGTMWSVVQVQNDLDLLKQRALALKAYYEDKQPK